MLYGYYRVSTKHQNFQRQIDSLIKNTKARHMKDILKLLNYNKFELNSKINNVAHEISLHSGNKIDISFFEPKWQKSIKKYDYSKKVVGRTVINTIRESIRSGDLFIRESRKYNSYDNYLISPKESPSDTKGFEFFNH